MKIAEGKGHQYSVIDWRGCSDGGRGKNSAKGKTIPSFRSGKGGENSTYLTKGDITSDRHFALTESRLAS